MTLTNLRFAFAAAVLSALVGVGACNCNGSTSKAAEEDQESKAAEANAPSGEESGSNDEEGASKGEAPPGDLYPGMDFGRLEADERRTFVGIAEREVCPCPEANTSLHKCLQEAGGTCAVAKRSATIIARGIRAGLGEDDILDKVAKFVEEARQEHDFTLEGVPHKGPKDAPVRIVEFADFECPHCKRASDLLKTVVSARGDEVVQYFKHFPLSGHGKARMAARAAVAAHMQGKFWPMHDLLFKNQKSLSKRKVGQFARRLGLNSSKFKKDMASEKAAQVVERDRQEGLDAQISGTPALFINGRRYMGPLTKEGLVEAIEAAGKSSSGESEGGGAGASSANKGGD